MAYTALTEEGKKFIRYYCQGTGNSNLIGKNKDGALPYQLQGTGKPQLSPNYLWTATPYYNNKLIATNQELGEALIDWYDKYAKQYEIDANIIAAQGYAESAYCVWVYPMTSDASGISQFTIDTLITIILNNVSNVSPIFTNDEIIKIFDVGIVGTLRVNSTYQAKISELGKQNRAALHQNVINNPDLMIKAQARYIKYIANNCDSLATWTLFGYAAGIRYTKINSKPKSKTYPEAVTFAKNDGNKHIEGINYIFKIFCLLGDQNNVNTKSKKSGLWFGYKLPKMNINMSIKYQDQLAMFNPTQVNINNTNNLG